MKLIKQQNFIIATTSGLLVLLAFAFLFPIPSSVVSASECTSADSSSCTKDAALPRAQTPSLSIALQGDSVDMNITPIPAGAFSAQTFAVRIATDNATGYSLYLSTKDGKSTLTNIHDPNIVINPVERSTPKSNFPSNSWGYKHLSENEEITDAAIFQPVPATQTFFRVVNVAKEETLKFAVAAKVDTSLPSGTYANAVVLSVIANPLPPSDISEISTMQEMTPEICENMPLADAQGANQYQLTDSRDGKTYYIAKIKDRVGDAARCWMTQNLAYDFVKGTVLTAKDSNSRGDWTIPNDALKLGVPGDTADTSLDMWKGNHVTDGHDSYGNYYSWGAATAGTANTMGGSSGNLGYSICPKGWNLPMAGNGYWFNTLLDGITVSAIKKAPYYYVGSSNVSPQNGKLATGGAGLYWSQNFPSATEAYTLYFYDSSIYGTKVEPSSSNFRRSGCTIRCVFRM